MKNRYEFIIVKLTKTVSDVTSTQKLAVAKQQNEYREHESPPDSRYIESIAKK